jgi:hypothetical protein
MLVASPPPRPVKPSEEEKEATAKTEEGGATGGGGKGAPKGGRGAGGEGEDVSLDFFGWQDEVKADSGRPKKVKLFFFWNHKFLNISFLKYNSLGN